MWTQQQQSKARLIVAFFLYQEKKTQKHLIQRCWRRFKHSRHLSIIQTGADVIVLLNILCLCHVLHFFEESNHRQLFYSKCVGTWYVWEHRWMNSKNSLSSMIMQMRMEMMAPVPRPAAATAPRVVQSPFSSQGHTLTLMTDLLDNGGFPESDTITGTSYTPGSKYIWYRRLKRAKSPVKGKETLLTITFHFSKGLFFSWVTNSLNNRILKSWFCSSGCRVLPLKTLHQDEQNQLLGVYLPEWWCIKTHKIERRVEELSVSLTVWSYFTFRLLLLSLTVWLGLLLY